VRVNPCPRPRLLTSAEVDALLLAPGNLACADCAPGGMARAGSGKAQRPLWASVSLGVVLSVQAAGVHRKLGVQTSKARGLVHGFNLCLLLTRGGKNRNNDHKVP
jgi:hypothetical protein